MNSQTGEALRAFAHSLRDVDLREQNRQQDDADGDLDGEKNVASALGWRDWSDIRCEVATLYYVFVRKLCSLMHILMIAPEPFFEPRGTPFSEFHRIRALTDLGHTVDLVTYPFGHVGDAPRPARVPGAAPAVCHRREDRPLAAKVPLDILLSLTALRRALGDRYDAVHSHEEGGLIGVVLAALLRVPHLYDMHSSLPQQLSNFAFTSRDSRGACSSGSSA